MKAGLARTLALPVTGVLGFGNTPGSAPLYQGYIKLPDREPSRLAAGENGHGRWAFWGLLPSWPLRAGTARGPNQSLMQACRYTLREIL